MRHWLPLSIAAIVLLAGRDGSVSAQAPPRQFEFVSVRQVPPLCGLFEVSLRCERQTPAGSSWRAFAGGRLEVTNHRAIDLVRVAYGLERFDPRYVSGGPRWMERQHYDVIALTGADGQPGQRGNELTTQVRSMLRVLLEDRFKLRVRVVTKKADVFLLKRYDVGPPGRGLKPSRGECQSPAFQWGYPACGRFTNGRIDASDVSIAEFADMLSTIVRRPVLDETSLAGRYDISAESPRSFFTGMASFASLAETLRRELGFELEPAKRMVDQVEITSAERPVDD
jgi:uncharacterized protein (TIGR03435 family)